MLDKKTAARMTRAAAVKRCGLQTGPAPLENDENDPDWLADEAVVD